MLHRTHPLDLETKEFSNKDENADNQDFYKKIATLKSGKDDREREIIFCGNTLFYKSTGTSKSPESYLEKTREDHPEKRKDTFFPFYGIEEGTKRLIKPNEMLLISDSYSKKIKSNFFIPHHRGFDPATYSKITIIPGEYTGESSAGPLKSLGSDHNNYLSVIKIDGSWYLVKTINFLDSQKLSPLVNAGELENLKINSQARGTDTFQIPISDVKTISKSIYDQVIVDQIYFRVLCVYPRKCLIDLRLNKKFIL